MKSTRARARDGGFEVPIGADGELTMTGASVNSTVFRRFLTHSAGGTARTKDPCRDFFVPSRGGLKRRRRGQEQIPAPLSRSAPTRRRIRVFQSDQPNPP